MIQARRIGHATFEAPDLDRAIEHYTQTVGLLLAGRDGLARFSRAASASSRSSCSRVRSAGARGSRSKSHPTLDLAALSRWLTSQGIANETRSDSIPGHPEVLSFRDPKGTQIDLFARWSFINDATDLVAGPLKFGHLAFVVPDPASMAEFYQTILGFRISDWIEDFFVFLRCNADHHVVNFIRGQTVRMHHMAFELKDFAQLQGACELLARRRVPIVWGPVRLGPGHNVAIFHRTADDHVLELYASSIR